MSAREAILEAADALFGEVGFDAAPTRQIAERSGVNKALIHYHFKDKEALWGAVLDRYYDRLLPRVEGALAEPGPLRARLLRLLETYLDFLVENGTFARMVQREIAGGRHTERVTDRMLPLFTVGARLLEAAWPGCRGGDLDAAHLLVSFYGMAITWVTYAPVVRGLTGADPLSGEALEGRKRHLARLVDLVIAELETTAPPSSVGEGAAPDPETDR